MTKTVVTQSPRAETPFTGNTPWPGNRLPIAGVPTRSRSQSIVTSEEAAAGLKLIELYIQQEAIVTANDIESRQDQLRHCKGIGAELLKREITACDYGKWEAAQGKLAELRKEAFELVKPIFRRLVKSLDSELNEAALASEARLDKAGIPVRFPDGTWMLHNDAICRALWSQKTIVEKTFVASWSPAIESPPSNSCAPAKNTRRSAGSNNHLSSSAHSEERAGSLFRSGFTRAGSQLLSLTWANYRGRASTSARARPSRSWQTHKKSALSTRSMIARIVGGFWK